MAEPQTNQLPEHSIDPNVSVPKHVRDAAAAADAIYAQAYPQEVTPEPDSTPQEITPEPEPQPQVTAAVTPQTPPVDNYSAPATSQEIAGSEWAARYNSMHGRWQSAQRQIGMMQDQMSALAQELQNTQSLLEQRGNGTAVVSAQAGQNHGNLITEADVDTYGADLIDLTQRAARAAVAPELEVLRGENQELKKRVLTSAQRDVYSMLDRDVATWRAINSSPDFKYWLSLPNVYTNQLRSETLNAAFKAANAPRVVAVFQDFIKEVRATGGVLPGSRPEPQVQQQQNPAPHEPAIRLETLAAPGRARPAGGQDPQQPADKPFFTRAQVSAFYRNSRLAQTGQGPYAGREAAMRSDEQAIYQAQTEGRIRG